MSMILKISFRNLIRQKRRNLLLGIGIAFGTCILIVANAFSHGISDILLNKLIAVIFGHVVVTTTEKYEGGDIKDLRMIRDQARIREIIQQNVEGLEWVDENVSTYARGLGKSGAAEFIVLVGVLPVPEFYEELPVEAGNLRDLENPNIENPIAVYADMAESLDVQVNDTLRVRLETIYGQAQSARFTVVAILKTGNPFMSFALFTHLNILKPLLGYQPHETAFFSIRLKHLTNPNVALEQANRLHQALQPNVAGFQGNLSTDNCQKAVQMFAVAPEEQAQQTFASQITLTSGMLPDLWQDAQGVLLSQAVADECGVNVGDAVSVTYQPKFEATAPPQTYRVAAIFQATETLRGDMAFLSATPFYQVYLPMPPKEPVILDRTHPVFPVLLKEWRLLERSPDQDALQKKYRELKNSKWRGMVVDVQTMYEGASDVLQLEQVLDMVTLIAVLVLFFIILIGVVNTLRMTIRERTREIGTVRAIGMQQRDVRWTFMLEVLLLTIIASFVGAVAAFAVMKVLALHIFQSTESFFTIFLVDRHLHFVVTATDVLRNLAIIIVIALVTSYFPARRAAKLSVAEALRHYE